MALFQGVFRSEALNQDTCFNIIIPQDCPKEEIRTVYLLHGMHGDHTGWCRKTSIERYAQDRRLAIVMPDGENGFYTDMKYGKKHYTYVAEELVDYTRRIFRLSEKRENTFICGLSMGGYGALRLALMKPEQYAAAASLSGCVDIVRRLQTCNWTNEAAAIWGDDFRTCVKGTDGDTLELINRLEADPNRLKPRIFACCGKQDFLYADNIAFRDFMKDKSFDFTFEDGDGVHNWAFWDKWVVRALDFFLEK